MRNARNGFQCHSHISTSDEEAVAANTTNLSGSAATVEGPNEVTGEGKGGEPAGA